MNSLGSDRPLSNDHNARRTAVRILTRAEKEKAYVNLLLQRQLRELGDSRDRQLAAALVNGTLKNRLTLDYAIRRHLKTPMSALPHMVRAILRTGAFQLLYMDRIPAAAAVNEAVKSVKAEEPKFAGLVNSVLHRVAEVGWEFPWPDQKKEPARYLAVKYSHPQWLAARWLARWGLEETEKLCISNNLPAPTCIRTNTLKISRENLVSRLENEGIQVTLSAKTPEGLFIEDFGALDELLSYQEGLFTVQDESSQLVAHILGVKPGERVLDVCCAPGGKTTHLAQLMNNQGTIIGNDLYPAKLSLVNELVERLGIGIIQTQAGDAGILEGIEGRFDKVLVDAPCSGLGVIRRRADLRWQKSEQEIKELSEIQKKILLRAADFVAPGGEMVYSTCTIEPEENFEVVKVFRAERPDFSSVSLTGEINFPVTAGDKKQLAKGVFQILPHLYNMDGFFLAKFRRAGL
ncbi:sun protein [Syntrophobotulus glycolicus DSM 8271]|uniref:16S rRNA (cytosine(967)-C(5))-methyltransferase n=1 Tax=Syntrophobotulus glycolicus (strain DSM 8271 / FlGlyR) TaxID=645991 RepID=F0SUR3_SYNGF|nr:sun protein [Syntrophobotulus glycolicus DSM 8271]